MTAANTKVRGRPGDDMDTGTGGSHGDKVARVVDEYGLEGTGAELEARWLGEAGERASLRDLADWFNGRVLAAALRRHGALPIDDDVSGVYRALTDDDVDAARRTSVRRRLERAGVDADDVTADFVSHQTVHAYLREVRGASLPETDDEAEREVERIRKLVGRTTAVAEDGLDRLRERDEVTVGEVDVFTRVQVLCRDCGAQYDAVELIERGACECADTIS